MINKNNQKKKRLKTKMTKFVLPPTRLITKVKAKKIRKRKLVFILQAKSRSLKRKKLL